MHDMTDNFWKKQKLDEPLFPDILWSRPESRSGAGKMAVIGGHGHGFGAPGIAWQTSLSSGAGVVRVILPDAVKKTVKHVLPDADFAPSNPSGSFSKKALSDLLDIANWSDCTILAGDLGRNSETAVVLEDFTQKYSGLLTVTHDAADYFNSTPKLILDRENTLVVISLAQLQKMFINYPIITPITYSMTELQLAEALRDLTTKVKACVVVKHNDTIFIAFEGQVVSSEFSEMPWRIKTASKASVFWMQNPNKILEATSSSIIPD